MTIGLRALVLNADYVPANILRLSAIPVEDAIIRVINRTCVVVDTYGRVFKTLRIENRFPIPSVIACTEYFKRPEILPLTTTNLLLRDRHKCVYCGKKLSIATTTYEHFVPKSRGGPCTWDNILAACSICNHGLSDTPSNKKKPSHKPYVPSYAKLVALRRYQPINVDHQSWINWIQPWFAEIKVEKTFDIEDNEISIET